MLYYLAFVFLFIGVLEVMFYAIAGKLSLADEKMNQSQRLYVLRRVASVPASASFDGEPKGIFPIVERVHVLPDKFANLVGE